MITASVLVIVLPDVRTPRHEARPWCWDREECGSTDAAHISDEGRVVSGWWTVLLLEPSEHIGEDIALYEVADLSGIAASIEG